MSQQTLEARYRWLLRAYPKGYRREHGAEMIGTLMEAAGADQRRPTAREAAALVRHGLRARAGAHRVRSTGQAWLGALRLAVLLLLVYATAASLAHTGRLVSRILTGHAVEHPTLLIHPLGTVIASLALLAVARGWYLLGLLATLGAFAATLAVLVGQPARDIVTGEVHYQPIMSVLDTVAGDYTTWPLPLAAALTAPLLRWRISGTRRPLAWLLGVLAAVVLLPTAYDVTTGVQPWGTVVVMVGFLLWVAVDARATVAATALLLPSIIAVLFMGTRSGWDQPPIGDAWFWTLVIGAVILLSTGAARLRKT